MLNQLLHWLGFRRPLPPFSSEERTAFGLHRDDNPPSEVSGCVRVDGDGFWKPRAYLIHDPELPDGIVCFADNQFRFYSRRGLVLGRPDCQFSAQSYHLRCAVNPKGPCYGCSHFEAVDDERP